MIACALCRQSQAIVTIVCELVGAQASTIDADRIFAALGGGLVNVVTLSRLLDQTGVETREG